MRRIETMSITIGVSFDVAYRFISEPSNLHIWTVDFAVKQPVKTGDIYRVETPRGTLDLYAKSDAESGVIDFYYGREGEYACSPSRLVRHDGGVVYLFTQPEPPGAAADVFERLVSNVRLELRRLKEHLESAKAGA